MITVPDKAIRLIPIPSAKALGALEPLPLALVYGIGYSSLFSRASSPVRV
jgi:hypothetical protein